MLYHSNETFLVELLHITICHLGFYKTNLICFGGGVLCLLKTITIIISAVKYYGYPLRRHHHHHLLQSSYHRNQNHYYHHHHHHHHQ